MAETVNMPKDLHWPLPASPMSKGKKKRKKERKEEKKKDKNGAIVASTGIYDVYMCKGRENKHRHRHMQKTMNPQIRMIVLPVESRTVAAYIPCSPVAFDCFRCGRRKMLEKGKPGKQTRNRQHAGSAKSLDPFRNSLCPIQRRSYGKKESC